MKTKRLRVPVAMTIAGSDSGGGAGLQADLKTFAAVGVHGTSAITCLTAQSPNEVRAIKAMSADFVIEQIETVWSAMPPKAVKTGMLYSAKIIEAVAEFFAKHRNVPLIVDPVMVATSGAVLLKPSAIKAMKEKLLPLAELITPNLDEAELLSGMKLRNVRELRDGAASLEEQFGCDVLLKGGHLSKLPKAIDVLRVKGDTHEFEAPFVRRISTHGTGCTYSASIAAYRALGLKLPDAVAMSKTHVTNTIAQSWKVGKFDVLNPFWA